MSVSSVKTGAIGDSLLAGNTAYEPGDYVSIATVTVGSGGASSVDFSSIPSTYQHLQIRCIMKSTSSTLTQFRMNADTGSNYSYHQIYGTGSGVGAAGGDNQSRIFFGQTSATASVMGVAVIDILDYKDTNKFKTMRSLMGMDENGGGTVRLFSGSWRNTNAVTSLQFTPDGGTWAQYTTFALYGIAG